MKLAVREFRNSDRNLLRSLSRILLDRREFLPNLFVQRDLLEKGYQTYVIDDAELDRIYKSYPNLWKDKHGTPQRVFLGCPHMTLGQMTEWGHRIVDAIEKAGKSKIGVPTQCPGFNPKIMRDKNVMMLETKIT